MDASESKMLDKYKQRIKRQNRTVKENYDRVSATLPKGTVDRIKALGMTINGAINESLLAFLDVAEEENNSEVEQNEDSDTNSKIQPISESTDKRTEAEIMAELNALWESKKAEGTKRLEQQRKKDPEPEEEIKPPVYFDIAGNPINDPAQYRIDMARQRERKQRERLELIHGKEYVAKLYGDSPAEP